MTDSADVKYETRTVRTVRGMEARTRSKLEQQGWEFVSQDQGTIRSELTFRRPKPKVPWLLVAIGAGLIALIIVGSLIAGALRNDEHQTGAGATDSPSATQPAESSPSSTPSSASASPTPTKSAIPSSTPTPSAASVEEITVDALAERINTGDYATGDRFRVTGALVGEDAWMTGAAGEFTVYLKTQTGSDLLVFADEAEASQWSEGSVVEMLLEVGEATINGETSDGWLRAISTETLG